jgi:hypothetical protein
VEVATIVSISQCNHERCYDWYLHHRIREHDLVKGLHLGFVEGVFPEVCSDINPVEEITDVRPAVKPGVSPRKVEIRFLCRQRPAFS